MWPVYSKDIVSYNQYLQEQLEVKMKAEARIRAITQAPTMQPTGLPTALPTVSPTMSPSVFPTAKPTVSPTPASGAPTASPTAFPSPRQVQMTIRHHSKRVSMCPKRFGGKVSESTDGYGMLGCCLMERAMSAIELEFDLRSCSEDQIKVAAHTTWGHYGMEGFLGTDEGVYLANPCDIEAT